MLDRWAAHSRIRKDVDDPVGPSKSPMSDPTADDGDSPVRIRCPKCKWQPGKHDRWQCSCLHIWNTF